ncbi:hypothetical protein [Notoacmeibacter sp. MSK16QG-6]|uniref:TipJ family phage tail tip protein n=1 Tax=Notoacmeibacter sp. MSK16QG-6 TaxID=2957982 RepID=UPI00209EAB24|nr:hypothetical protein [Notoacmeibacter sp. MSK16QG-6]MCP1200046.1 hypothetical protein [Notoacmeibacter sp. MSK16QG-6]
MMTEPMVKVTVAHPFGPEGARSVMVPAGQTIEGMIRQAIPGHFDDTKDRLSISLASQGGSTVLSRDVWRKTKTRPGVEVRITVTPGEPASLIGAAVSVASAVAGGSLGATALGTVGASLLATGISVLGSLLVSLLFAPKQEKQKERKEIYRIEGLQNQTRRNEPIRSILGKIRVFPDYVVEPYTEIAGNIQYIRAAFIVGLGSHVLTEMKIGDTDLDDFNDVEYEVIQPGDSNLTLITDSTIENRYGVELLYRNPNGAGNIEDNAVPTPVKRTTAGNITSFTVIVAFPSGLRNVDDEGDSSHKTVSWKVEYRIEGETAWTLGRSVSTREKSIDPFYRSVTIDVPVRGRYEVQVTRTNREDGNPEDPDTITFVSLQSHRPEYPINTDLPLTLIAIRIKGTHQLQGTLDAFNLVASRLLPDWDGAAWTEGETSNPASHYRHVLTGGEGVYPVSEGFVDDAALVDFHDFCATKGLKHDTTFEDEASQLERMASVCSAGRAAPQYDGDRWSVIIDRPSNLVADHFSPLNVRNFQAEKIWPRYPDGYRVEFLDAANNYQLSTRVIPWPGKENASLDLIEDRPLSGKTDPDEVWIEARRAMYEVIFRDEFYRFETDVALRQSQRGDIVRISHETLNITHYYSRAAGISGNTLYLTDPVLIEDGESYQIRFFLEDGTSVTTDVTGSIGEVAILSMAGDDMPIAGETILFGKVGEETVEGYVVEVEPGEDDTATYAVVPFAPEIDIQTDLETPPPWSGIVGDEVSAPLGAPGVPEIIDVSTSADGELTFVIRDDPTSLYRASTFELDWRLAGTTPWNTETTFVASGSVVVDGFSVADDVEHRARGITSAGTAGAYTAINTATVADLTVTPLAEPIGISLSDEGSGDVAVTVTAGNDTRITGIRIYRAADGDTFNDAVQVGSDIAANGNSIRTYTDSPGTGDWQYWAVDISNTTDPSDAAGPVTITIV